MILWPSGENRERHAGKIAHDLAFTRVEPHENDPRLVVRVLHVGDFLARRAEAGRENELPAVGQHPDVGAVLIHDGETLEAVVLGPSLVDEYDTRVEVALLQRQLLVDLVGDDVPDPAPIGSDRGELLACQWLTEHDVP